MNNEARVEVFEKMLSAVRDGYASANEKNVKAESRGQGKNGYVPSAYGR